MSKAPPETYVRLGILGKTYQLEGGLRFYPLGNAEAEAIFLLDTLFVEDVGEVSVRKVKQVGKNTVVYLSRALSVEAARKLVNHDIYAAPDALPEPEDGELYVDELLGMSVYLEDEHYGEVAEVLKAGLQDILVIQAENRVMVPLQAPYVTVTDDGVHLEDVPEGLLELN